MKILSIIILTIMFLMLLCVIIESVIRMVKNEPRP